MPPGACAALDGLEARPGRGGSRQARLMQLGKNDPRTPCAVVRAAHLLVDAVFKIGTSARITAEVLGGHAPHVALHWGYRDMTSNSTTDGSADGIDRLAAIFKSVDWVIPAYIPLGPLSDCAATIEQAPEPQKQAALEATLRVIYDERHFATFLLGLYGRTHHVRDFKAQIEEAIAAWFMGLHHAAVATMVPVLEGVIRKIARDGQREVGNGTRKVIAEIEELIAKEDRSPYRFEERIVMLTGLRDFFADRLFVHTADYDGLDQLNRHGILHGIFEQYGNAVNFLRLTTLLELLCFAMVLAHGGPSLAPAYTPEAEMLAERYRRLRQLAP